MAIFRSGDLENLLRDKYIVLIGDSVQRSIYKDLVVLFHENRFMSQGELRNKGEESFLDDKLVYRSELTNGTNYREVREFKKSYLHMKFYFITRVYNDYVESILKELDKPENRKPDVVVLNSCLWDISRYGLNSMEKYRENLKRLCCRLEEILPADTLVVWRTTLPVSEEMRGGFLTADAEWCREMLRLDVVKANYFAFNIVSCHKFDVLDMHYYFRFQLHRRAKDGVHWNMYAHRRMTNILLTHIAEAWSAELPELPWADNSRIEFTPDEIEMNATNVLVEAYEPKPAAPSIKPPNGLLPTPRTIRRRSISEMRYGGPIRSTHEMYSGYFDVNQMYSGYYDVPQEEPQADINYNHSPDYNGNYHFDQHDPFFYPAPRIALPTNPYPDMYRHFAEDCFEPVPQPVAHVGPVRRVRRQRPQRNIGHPGPVSHRLRMRMEMERQGRRRMQNVRQHIHGNMHALFQ